MKTILLILFIYFIFQMLRKATQGQPPRGEIPGYRSPGEDDAPLPGPWNRRREPADGSPLPLPRERRAEPAGDKPLPGPWERRTEPVEDIPLPGPWDRRQEQEKPVETETYNEPEYEPGKEPVGTKHPFPEPPPRDAAAEPFPRREKPWREDRKQPEKDGKTPRPVPGDKEPFCAPEDRAAAVRQPLRPERRHRRQVNPLEAVLRSKTTLVGSIVMGEVLGHRGGRAASRRK